MFRNVIGRLARTFHVVAPDYPGYGLSSMPDHKSFSYSFENLANIMSSFTEKLGLGKYIVYLMDHGAPISLRMALKNPDKIAGMIDTGHFSLETHGDEIVSHIEEFFSPLE
ncbi:MAG TPA: alpha/beta fold hydrolase [Acidisarcina sp.]